MKKLMIIPITSIVVLFAACGGNNDSANNDAANNENKRYDTALKEHLELFQPLSAAADAATLMNDPKVKLGYMLYYDTRLSKDGKNSCNSCHNLATYGVDNLPTSPGDKGMNGNRNSPTVLNASLHAFQFWDGRAKDVEEQAGMPILNPVEMNIPSEKFLVDRLKGITLYQELFKAAYPDNTNPITYENLRKAIGAFERTLITPSRFDQYLAGKTDALTVQEKRGFLAFNTIGCTSCHSGALLGGSMLQKTGVFGNYWDFTGSTYHDEGRAEVTQSETDKNMFKVPSLRNIEKTYPYFHDGTINDLGQMVKIMGKMQLKYELSDEETNNIVAFLKSLTGDIPESFKKAPEELKNL